MYRLRLSDVIMDEDGMQCSVGRSAPTVCMTACGRVAARCYPITFKASAARARISAAGGKGQALHMQVLRFFCVWDDRRALFGDRRPYRLHYFLEDGSCEILETREANSGREPFPVFLRRGPLPKVRKPVLTCFKCLPRLLLCRAANMWRCCEKEPLVAKGACISAMVVWNPCIWTLSPTSSKTLPFQEALI